MSSTGYPDFFNPNFLTGVGGQQFSTNQTMLAAGTFNLIVVPNGQTLIITQLTLSLAICGNGGAGDAAAFANVQAGNGFDGNSANTMLLEICTACKPNGEQGNATTGGRPIQVIGVGLGNPVFVQSTAGANVGSRAVEACLIGILIT